MHEYFERGFLMNDEEEILNEDNPVKDAAYNLKTAILQSAEYNNYIECAGALKADKTLYERVNNLRRRNFAIQNTNEQRIGIERFYDLSAEIRELRHNPIVNDFLDAEVELGRLFQQISALITEDIDFDVDFLD